MPHFRVLLFPPAQEWLQTQAGLTCILTCIPSPFCPDTVAVTTTSVSLPTKFLIHRSFFELWPCWATRSNFSASTIGRKRDRRERRATCRRRSNSEKEGNLAMLSGGLAGDFRWRCNLRKVQDLSNRHFSSRQCGGDKNSAACVVE